MRVSGQFVKLTYFPGWGTKSFWIKELEDLSTQLQVIRDQG